MSRQRQPSLRLLSLNVNGLRSADKRRTLFRLLHRDRWDVVLLQETHHTDEAEGQAWTQEGPDGLRPNWSGPSFWCHGSTTSRGVAILLSPSADISFFLFLEEEALHVSQICQLQQYQRTANGNLWDLGIHSTTHDGGSCFAMASDPCVNTKTT